MKSKEIKGQRISRLSLGTVQLGLNYGINNQSGKPDRTQAFAILNAAMQGGINALDTAPAYGDSEEVIGAWRQTVPETQRPFVTTKLEKIDHSSLEALRVGIRKQVEASKARLGVDTIPLLMLHSFEDYDCDRENMKQVFAELKERGDIRFSGISAYAQHDYSVIAASGFDAVQIPCNIFDWRQVDNGGIQTLADSGMMIFVRSVYLQGLVFQKPEELDPRMAFAHETLVKFRALCERFGLAPAELALSFALSLPGVTSLVLGSEKPEQVEQNIALLDRTRDLTEEEMDAIHAAFRNTDYRVLTPTTWYNA